MTYKEVDVVFLHELECATASPKAASVMMIAARAVLATAVALAALLLTRAVYRASQPSQWCPPMWEEVKLPKVRLRAARVPPPTEMMLMSFLIIKTAVPMTSVM